MLKKEKIIDKTTQRVYTKITSKYKCTWEYMEQEGEKEEMFFCIQMLKLKRNMSV